MNYEEEILNLKQRISKLEQLLNLNGAESNLPVNDSVKTSNRDKTKYMFNGKIYPKNRLVLAIVKQYVSDTNPDYTNLCSTFDKSLQGSLNVIESLQNAQKISDCEKRYFMKQENQLNLKDGITAVVCTQWGIFNIKKFIKQANLLGYNILEV